METPTTLTSLGPLAHAGGPAAVATSLPDRIATGDVGLLLPLCLAVALAIVHVSAVRLTFVDGVPRRSVLSLSAGASVSYVFVHLMPEIGRAQRAMAAARTPPTAVQRHAYLVALLGFVAYYGLERFARCSWPEPSVEEPGRNVFRLHAASFAVYNGLIGYLLVHRETPGLDSRVLFAFAIGLHVLVVDYGLRRQYPERYHDVGRWVLAGAILFGTALGTVTSVDRALLGGLFAFVAGGVVLNVVKEELPEERESRFWAFALGAGAYALVLLLP